jgi:hypothetical protein
MADGIIFEKASDYIESCTTLTAKIAAIDAILSQLLTTAATAAETGHIDEYWFDDGHVKIRSKYRNVAEVERSIMSFQRLRDLYANRKTGRLTTLKDASNFTGRC